MSKSIKMILLMAIFSTAAVNAAPTKSSKVTEPKVTKITVGSSPISRDARFMINRADHGRQEVARNARRFVMEGNRLLTELKYDQARDCYIQAKALLNRFSNSTIFQDQIKFCDRQISRCYYEKALEAITKAEELAGEKDFVEAIKLCQEAIKYCPEQADFLRGKIKVYQQRRDAVFEEGQISADRLVPNAAAQDYQIQVLLEQGRRLAASNELGKALRKFQEVLLITPYNGEAIQSINAINRRIGKIGHLRSIDTHKRLTLETEWKYAIPILPEGTDSVGRNLIEEKPKEKTFSKAEALTRKVHSIKFKVNLDQTPLSSAINTLRTLSRNNDPEKRGVNFFLLPKPVVKDATANKDGNNPEQENQNQNQNQNNNDENGEGEGDSEPLVVINFPQERSLYDAIQILCKQANLKFRIDEHAVVLAPADVALDNMERRIYPFDLPSYQSDEQLKNDFKAYGVTFPQGSLIFYDQKIKSLIAINTIDNHQLIEEAILIQQQNQQPMIQVMVKFIEMSQNDIDELAFNWNLSYNTASVLYENSRYSQDDWKLTAGTGNNPIKKGTTIDANGEEVTTSLKSPAGDKAKSTKLNSSLRFEATNQLMRYYTPESLTENSAPLNDGFMNYVYANDKGTRLMANMFALNWADSSDVLYSPRITTLDNQTAEVSMIIRQYFPEDFELLDIEDSDSAIGFRMTGASPQPNLDNEQELGLKFKITPQIVNLERGLIRAPINFPIKTFSEWMIFDARTTDAEGEIDGEYYQMPVFNNRTIDTEVMVYDGETVIIAGVATDLTEVVHDKIPILGDIPFIGRFFQSKYTSSKKGNLLIFLTCRLVKPDGTAWRASTKARRGVHTYDNI